MRYQSRVKTPTVIQMEQTECGAASLSIMMAYYGYYLTAEEARRACGVSRDGSKAINIVKAARNYGMEAAGSNLDIEELGTVTVPFIIFWNFNHFLVVEGYSKNKVYINDPMSGPRPITWEEFDKGYTGIVIELTPGPQFKPSGNPEASGVPLLLQKLGKNKQPFVYITCVTLALTVPKISLPIFTKIFIDQVLINNQQELFKIVLLAITFITITSVLLTWLQKRVLNKFNKKLTIVNMAKFMWHLFHIPIHYFQQRSSGDIVERSSISDKVADIFARDIIQAGVGLLEMGFIFIVIFLQSTQLGFALLSILCVYCIAIQLSNKKCSDLALSYAQDAGHLEAVQTSGLQIIESIKVAALEQHFFNQWVSFFTKFSKKQLRIMKMRTLITALPEALNLIFTIIIICYGSFLVMLGKITIGTVVAVQALIASFLMPFNTFSLFLAKLKQLKGDMARLSDVIDTKIDPHFADDPQFINGPPAKKSKIALRIRDLSFGYSPLEPPILSNFSMDVYAGQRVAIVGRSGSGKSSLAKLICGLGTPRSGNIKLHNIPLKKWSRLGLSKYIAYVDQRTLFFSASLRDNLTLWDNNISDDKIHSVLEQLGMYELIMERGGLGLFLTEGSNNFSGGQRQCIELARALLHEPQLLILDEATSALDPNWEAQIYQNLQSARCTILNITHRLSTVKDSDKIYVLDEGELVQEGNHHELILCEGLYKDLMAAEGI